MHELAAQCPRRERRITIRLAAELLEAHDDTGISLDAWPTAREFVEHHLGSSVLLHEQRREH